MTVEPYEPPPPPDDYAGEGEGPPRDIGAEQHVLGSMMVDPRTIGDVAAVLRPNQFYRPAHEQIAEAAIDLDLRGDPTDMVSVADELGRRGLLTKVGGSPYLHTLVTTLPVSVNAVYWANIVRKAWVRRRLIEAAVRVEQRSYDSEGDADLLADWAQTEMLNAVPIRGGTDYRQASGLVIDALDWVESLKDGVVPGISTGFPELDDLTGGWQPGQMITVAGRPGLGKSTLALDFMRAASIRDGLTSCLFSLEMPSREITLRLLSAEGKVSPASLRSGQVNEDDWGRLGLAAPKVMAAPIYVDDSPNLTMTEIRAKARRLVLDHDLRFMAIDYMQLMTSGRNVESRQVEVSEFSRQIKLMAKELQIPVVALSQLNRGPEQRSSKRPLMSDLRESGSIEQDSDIVILLHREDAYEKESDRPGEADLIVAKHRNGPTRDISVAAQLHYSRFAPLAHDYR